jgi:hypothetical protein
MRSLKLLQQVHYHPLLLLFQLLLFFLQFGVIDISSGFLVTILCGINRFFQFFFQVFRFFLFFIVFFFQFFFALLVFFYRIILISSSSLYLFLWLVHSFQSTYCHDIFYI